MGFEKKRTADNPVLSTFELDLRTDEKTSSARRMATAEMNAEAPSATREI